MQPALLSWLRCQFVCFVLGYQNHLKVLYTQNKRAGVETAPTRFISATPTRILDAPELNDDYYLNLLDWGACKFR
jgi:hypothetical protein